MQKSRESSTKRSTQPSQRGRHIGLPVGDWDQPQPSDSSAFLKLKAQKDIAKFTLSSYVFEKFINRVLFYVMNLMSI